MSTIEPALTPPEEPHLSFGSRLVRLLKGSARLLDRRTSNRLSAPPLRAYLGMVGSGLPFLVSNFSATGFFMVTDEHWQAGTCLPLRLERTDMPGFAAISRMAVQTCVVRTTAKGVGFAFLPIDEPEDQQELGDAAQDAFSSTRWAGQRALKNLFTELETQRARDRANN